jgi:hypothetical protein
MANNQPTQDLQGISKLQTVRTQEQANEQLELGWVLLALLDRRDGNDQYVEYHLGWPEEPATGLYD